MLGGKVGGYEEGTIYC